jgi:hypothetical protein
MDRHTFQDRLDTATATIADGESLSDAIDLGGMIPVGVDAPAANWTTAALSFQGSLDGTRWQDAHDDSGEYTTGDIAAGGGCSLNKDVFRRWRHIKIRSGTAASAVAQAGGDALTLIMEAR